MGEWSGVGREIVAGDGRVEGQVNYRLYRTNKNNEKMDIQEQTQVR